MYLTFIFYIPEDGHMIGRNMYEFIMYINQFQYNVLHLMVQLLYM